MAALSASSGAPAPGDGPSTLPPPVTPPLPEFVAKLVTAADGRLFWYATDATLAHLTPALATVKLPAPGAPS